MCYVVGCWWGFVVGVDFVEFGVVLVDWWFVGIGF